MTEPEVPTTLLTGFLGSGKTTVLRRLLTGDHGLRVSAIVNDLAAVNIDALTLAHTSDAGQADVERLELSDGCACCQLTDDLIASLAAAADGSMSEAGAPDAVVVEASGGADPVSMAAAIDAAPGIRLDGVVCVADAQAIAEQLADPVIGRLTNRQLEAAHVVLLTKADLVSRDDVAEVTSSIASVAPGRQVIPVEHGRVDPAILLAAAARGAALPTGGRSPVVGLVAQSVTPQPVNLALLVDWLESDHGLVRAKGWIVDADNVTHELQAVGRRWTLTALPEPHDPVVAVIATSVDRAERAVSAIDDLGKP
jgi:G3E family GTPase